MLTGRVNNSVFYVCVVSSWSIKFILYTTVAIYMQFKAKAEGEIPSGPGILHRPLLSKHITTDKQTGFH